MVTGPLGIKWGNKLGYEEERKREEEDSCVSWSGSPGTAAGVSHPQPAQVSRYSLHLYPVTAESAIVTQCHISALAYLICTGLSSFFRPQNKLSHGAEMHLKVKPLFQLQDDCRLLQWCKDWPFQACFSSSAARRGNVFTVMLISELCRLCGAGDFGPGLLLYPIHFSLRQI